MPVILRETGNPPFEKRLSFANELAFVLGKKIKPAAFSQCTLGRQKDFQNSLIESYSVKSC